MLDKWVINKILLDTKLKNQIDRLWTLRSILKIQELNTDKTMPLRIKITLILFELVWSVDKLNYNFQPWNYYYNFLELEVRAIL